MTHEKLSTAFKRIYRAGLEAVDPEKAVLDYLQRNPIDSTRYRKILLAGIGKAGVPMARAVEEHLGGALEAGRIIVKEGHGGTLRCTEVREAGHPEPDRRGESSARELVTFLQTSLDPEDLLVFVISGGGSALFPLPVPPLTFEDKRAVTSVLIRCGADIHEINTLRKHLSQVKGGRLVEVTGGARVLSLVLSDVIGDSFASIASGPLAPDPSTFQDCIKIIERYNIRDQLPAAALEYLEKGAAAGPEAPKETLKSGDPRFERIENILVANNLQALERSAEVARSEGFAPIILSSAIPGNTADVASVHVAITWEVLNSGNPVQPPCCLISGGETTVQVKGDGKGGRNMEFVLQCARQIADWPNQPVLFASLGSDGNDGPTEAAGAVATCDTARRGLEMGMDPDDFLRRNDSYPFFERLGDLIVTGPTRTNVMDLRFVLIDRSP